MQILTKGNGKNYADKNPAFEISQDVFEKLKICGGISSEEIEDKTFPRKICQKCFLDLETCFEFWRLCQQSHKILKENLRNAQSRFKKQEDILNNPKVEFVAPAQEPIEKDEEFFENKSHARFTLHSYSSENVRLSQKINLIPEKIHLKFAGEKPHSTKSIDVKNIFNTNLGIKPNKKLDEQNHSENRHHLCEFCGKNYVSKFSMQNHMRLHSARLRFACGICDDSYARKFQLEQHMCSKHTGERNFKCEYCDKTFFSKILKNKHQRRSHSKRFKCDQCDKYFGRPDLLKKHIRVHTGEKPIVCDKCGTRFKELHHLKTHNKSMSTCVLKMSIKVNDK
ncbi:zinc finger protein 112-like isoform X2 [Condylostylus longicornis]|uniref:zinc finger protein 112-like isoform X2 n=1 Tax=Condylostylus longicornis TaxID=2530218 RepID=UPI00244E4E1B|nr:zinc finger protein 112-like isoform X2 [Condylostylus longicornis]